MKKLYWRPRGVSRSVLLFIALVSLLGLLAVEFVKIRQRQMYYSEKLQAAQVALEGMEIIGGERLSIDEEVDPDIDPAQSGLIGLPMSSVTTVTGSLTAKQTSANPNFAAVVVQMLKDAGVQKGDVVAVGASGSFPALNICVYAALQTLELRAIIISSASASQFGANDPEFLWIDMEQILHEYDSQRFPFRSVAASLGGVEDRGLGMPKEGRQTIIAAIERHGLTFLKPESFKDSIDKRMHLYGQHARGQTIKAYINIGGGTISVGMASGKRMFSPGLNLRKPAGLRHTDSVMTRFVERGIPVIHLTKTEVLAQQYGLPIQPKSLPTPGEGQVFYREEYNAWLAAGVLLAIFVSLYAFVRSEVGYRILQTKPTKGEDLFHEPMV